MLRIEPAPLAADPARVLIERQLAWLTRLAEIGMGVAEDAGRRSAALADGADAGVSAADPALAYARAARAVRMTIALQSRLMADLAALDRADSLAQTARAGARRGRAHRLVERAIEAEHEDDGEAIERLSLEAWERLTDEDDADIEGRPLPDIVAAVCRDLGLSAEETAWAVSQVVDGAAERSFTGGPGLGGPDPPRVEPPATGTASARPNARSRASPAIATLDGRRREPLDFGPIPSDRASISIPPPGRPPPPCPTAR